MAAVTPPLVATVTPVGGQATIRAIDHAIDITARHCPMTFVHTRLALDRLGPGQVLQVRLNGADARANVPRSAAELGHAVLAVEDQPNGDTLVTIQKA